MLGTSDMLTKEIFNTLYDAGFKAQCYTECRRYGRISDVHDYDLADGAHRLVSATHHGMHFSFHLHNGVVIRMSKETK